MTGFAVDSRLVVCDDVTNGVPGVDCAVSPGAELDRLRRVNNRLVLAAVSMLGVGIGVTSWGIAVDDHGTLMPRVRIRF